ncbi:hypothetical protein E4656_19055 [Natronospirillum operosum]|uniref:EF-hand domain-containing protein n=1 Tax=Natronospirillum operosum TaxID=2759953 RepID=A0A4Z0W1W6_9GAMM|nr:hypothetical protein [Natronospirillum operosum]TGG90226.1 hypothetical protein E4656_19055 [Natronospirillum operosum]
MKKSIFTSAAAASLVVAFASSAVMANDELFEQLDVNGDGVITLEEAQAHPDVYDQFDDLDSDGSGELTPEEFEAFEPDEDMF